LKHIIWTLNKIDVDPETNAVKYPFGKNPENMQKPWMVDEKSEQFQMIRSNILRCERVCLQVLGFNFNVAHPVMFLRPFMDFIDSIRLEEEPRRLGVCDESGNIVGLSELGHRIMSTATSMGNDTSLCTVCVQYKAGVLAAGCLELALRMVKFKKKKIKQWTKELTEKCAAWGEADTMYRGVVVEKDAVSGLTTPVFLRRQRLA
jgi:hypothetical protein